MTAARVQRHVDHFLRLSSPGTHGDTLRPRVHQDVFTEVLSGEAEVDEGGAELQGAEQLQEGKVVVMERGLKTFMELHGPHPHDPFSVA